MNVPSNRFFTPPSELTPSWHKATDDRLNNYQTKVKTFFKSKLIQTPQTPDEIEKLNKILTDTLINLEKETMPLKKFNPHTKPYWNK